MEKRNRIIVYALPLIGMLLGLVIYQYGYEKVHGRMVSVRDLQTSKAKTLEKYMTVLSEKPLWENQLTALKEKRKADESNIIQAPTLSLAAATLVDTAKGIISGKGGSLSSERVEKPEDQGKFKVVNVSMDMTLPDIRALSEVVYSIETRTPYLVIKELDVRVRDFRQPRELMVRMRVAALTGAK